MKEFADALVKKQTYKLQEVEPLTDSVRIKYTDGECFLTLRDEDGNAWFEILDAEGERCALSQDTEGLYYIKGKKNLAFTVGAQEDGGKYIAMRYKGVWWEFIKESGEAYVYRNQYGKADTISAAPSAFGEGYERLFTGRVYLWSRTLPLLKDYLLTGSGPNTFAAVFPQNDYVMRLNTGVGMMTEVISRPHSFYLQTAVQTGVLSLAILLALFVKCLLGAERDAAFYAAVGFLVMGLTNDALVVTAPVFWTVLGLVRKAKCNN